MPQLLGGPPGRAPSKVVRTAPDAVGATFIAWEDFRSGTGSGVYAQKLDANGAPLWTDGGVAVCLATGYQSNVVAVTDGAGGLFVAWEDDRTEDMSNSDVYAQHLDATGVPMWTSDGVAVCTAIHYQRRPQIVRDGADGAILVWTDWRGADYDLYAQRVNGSGSVQWTANGVPVCTAVEDQQQCSVVEDGAGGAHVVWEDARAGLYLDDIYAQHLDAAGTPLWPLDGLTVCAATDAQVAPLAVTDGAGGLIAGWLDFRTGVGADVYAQRVGASGVGRWAADGVAVCTNAAEQQYLGLVVDGAGGAIAAWVDTRAGTRLEIYAQRVDSLGVPQWTTDGATVCSSTGTVSDVALAPDDAHGLIAAWQDYRDGGESNVFAQRLDSFGAAVWAVNGIPVCAARSFQFGIAVSPDGGGGAVVSWDDFRAELDMDLYAQRVEANGAPQWMADGILVRMNGRQHGHTVHAAGGGNTVIAWAEKMGGQYDIRARMLDASGQIAWGTVDVCTAPGLQYLPLVSTDGAGGVIIAWMDWRAENDEYDLYAQRIGADGAPLWPANGVPLSVASGNQGFHGIVSDGAGGAIVAWEDSRNGAPDIYAQRVNALGARLWTSNGMAVCSSPNSDQHPALVADDHGGAIIAWQGGSEFFGMQPYAQHLDSSGAVLWSADGIPLCAAQTSEEQLAIARDGQGGAIVVRQQRPASDTDLWGQRVAANGVLRWGTEGVAVASGTGSQDYAVVLADGESGVFVAWSDSRSGPETDIYAQRLDSLGVARWTANGVAVCAATAAQAYPSLTSDAAGGVIVAWADGRDGPFADVYAQRLNGAGTAFWVPLGNPVCDEGWNQFAVQLVGDGAAGAVAVWTDMRDGVQYMLYAQRLDHEGDPLWSPNGYTSALLALTHAEVTPSCAHLAWYASEMAGAAATVYRSGVEGEWATLGAVLGDGTGTFVVEDRTVVPGQRYGYRLGLVVSGTEQLSETAWIDVPRRASLALESPRPHPAVGELRVAFSLVGSGTARFDLLDVAGRCVRTWPLAGALVGTQMRSLGRTSGLAPGVYMLRLVEGGASVQRRVTILD